MPLLHGATALARALLALDRVKHDSVLEVRALGRRARLVVRERCLLRVELPAAHAHSARSGHRLGDHLAALGVPRSALAARTQRPAGPIGLWLVQQGACSDRHVQEALGRQNLERLLSVARWQAPDWRLLSPQQPEEAAWQRHAQPLPLVALQALERASLATPTDDLRHALPRGPLRLTDTGERLAAFATPVGLTDHVLQLLRTGTTAECLIGAHPPALRGLWILHLLGGVVPPTPNAYGLLLRKRRQLSRGEPAHALLDVSRDCSHTELRIAFRTLVRQLHPDRFGARAGRLHEGSSDVLRALVAAHRELGAHPSRH